MPPANDAHFLFQVRRLSGVSESVERSSVGSQGIYGAASPLFYTNSVWPSAMHGAPWRRGPAFPCRIVVLGRSVGYTRLCSATPHLGIQGGTARQSWKTLQSKDSKRPPLPVPPPPPQPPLLAAQAQKRRQLGDLCTLGDNVWPNTRTTPHIAQREAPISWSEQ